MHGAHNTAYELIETELNVCIDSDDYLNRYSSRKNCYLFGINIKGME